MKLRLTPPAEADVRDIYNWYRDQGEGLAPEFRRALDACLNRVRRNLMVYAKVHGEIRRAMLQRFPYCVFYIVDESEVGVIGVFHGHRDPQIWQSRHDA